MELLVSSFMTGGKNCFRTERFIVEAVEVLPFSRIRVGQLIKIVQAGNQKKIHKYLKLYI